jgi:outer membrane protein
MKNHFLKSLLLAVTFLLPNAALAQGATIIVFDLEVAVSSSKSGQDMSKQVQALAEALRERVDAFGVELQADAAKLQEQRSLLAPEAFKVKVEELQLNEQTNRQKFTAEGQAIQAGGQRASREILNIADEELNAISKERKADIVMNRKAVFFASPAIDVTEELVSRLNKRLSSVKVTPVVAAKN